MNLRKKPFSQNLIKLINWSATYFTKHHDSNILCRRPLIVTSATRRMSSSAWATLPMSTTRRRPTLTAWSSACRRSRSSRRSWGHTRDAPRGTMGQSVKIDIVLALPIDRKLSTLVMLADYWRTVRQIQYCTGLKLVIVRTIRILIWQNVWSDPPETFFSNPIRFPTPEIWPSMA